MKQTFASKTFASSTFASGAWAGLGVAAATPALTPLELLQHMLADSPTFRELVGADDRDEALLSIYRDGLPEPADGGEHTLTELTGYRPYAIVEDASEPFDLRVEADGAAGHEWASAGSLRITIERTCPDAYDDQPSADSNLDFKNVLGNILDDLADLAGGSGELLDFDAITLRRGPAWTHPNLAATEGVAQSAELLVEYGGEP